MPVGVETLGRIINVIGEPVDEKGPIFTDKKSEKYAPLHRAAPTFTEQGKSQEILVTGIKVVEMGQLLAGPFCGQLLGDMGADVVKIEPPGAGDPMRNWGQGDEKVQWEVIARNKRSVTCNLRVPEGQALAKRLIAEADVLIENFKPGTLAEWGVGYADVAAVNAVVTSWRTGTTPSPRLP